VTGRDGMTPGEPLIIVISGPSGVGKSTVAEQVLEKSPGLVRSVSLTTRRPRGGDVDGEDYHFVSPEEFAARREAGCLLEWAEVHGNLYGTETEQVDRHLAEGKSVLLEIDVQGGGSVKSARRRSRRVCQRGVGDNQGRIGEKGSGRSSGIPVIKC